MNWGESPGPAEPITLSPADILHADVAADGQLPGQRAHRHRQHVDIWCHVDKLSR